jgi:restriction endonuclease S subunit
MQYSVVSYSDIPAFDKRIDPEFYESKNIKLENQLRKINSIPLGDLCYLFDGPFGSELLSSSYSEYGVPALRMQNVTKSGLPKLDNVEFISDQDADRLIKHIAYSGDVVTTKIGFLGYSTVLPNSYERYFFRRELTRLVIKGGVDLQPNYLATFLNTSHGRIQALRYSTGTTRDRVLLVNQRHMLIPIFSNKLQSLISNLIIESHRFIELSESKYKQAQTLLLSELGLTNWQPKYQLTFIKNYSDTQQSERIDAEYYQPKYDEMINVIKNYSGGWDTLDNLVYIKKCIEVGSREYLDEGIPFVRVSNISPFEITEEKYISESLYQELTPVEDNIPFEKSKNYQPQQGEILFSKDGTPGIANYLKEQPRKMIPSGGILRLKSKTDKVINEYLTLVLNSVLIQEQVNRDVGGSIILHWRPDQVKATVIPILSKGKQSQIQQKVTESFSLLKQSKHLLESAKKAVEMAIEKNEQAAITWLKNETKEMQI